MTSVPVSPTWRRSRSGVFKGQAPPPISTNRPTSAKSTGEPSEAGQSRAGTDSPKGRVFRSCRNGEYSSEGSSIKRSTRSSTRSVSPKKLGEGLARLYRGGTPWADRSSEPKDLFTSQAAKESATDDSGPRRRATVTGGTFEDASRVSDPLPVFPDLYQGINKSKTVSDLSTLLERSAHPWENKSEKLVTEGNVLEKFKNMLEFQLRQLQKSICHEHAKRFDRLEAVLLEIDYGMRAQKKKQIISNNPGFKLQNQNMPGRIGTWPKDKPMPYGSQLNKGSSLNKEDLDEHTLYHSEESVRSRASGKNKLQERALANGEASHSPERISDNRATSSSDKDKDKRRTSTRSEQSQSLEDVHRVTDPDSPKSPLPGTSWFSPQSSLGLKGIFSNDTTLIGKGIIPNLESVLKLRKKSLASSNSGTNATNRSANSGNATSGSLPSGLSDKANINNLAKFQADHMMLARGFISASSVPVSMELTSLPRSDVPSGPKPEKAPPLPLAAVDSGGSKLSSGMRSPAVDTDTERIPSKNDAWEVLSAPCEIRDGSASPNRRSPSPSSPGRRANCRRPSTSSTMTPRRNLSLEGLRQQNDQSLALCGLNSHSTDASGKSQAPSSPIQRRISESGFSATSGSDGSTHNSGSSFGSTVVGIFEFESRYIDEPIKRRLHQLPWVVVRVCGIIPLQQGSIMQGSILANFYSLVVLLLAATSAVYPAIRIAQYNMVGSSLLSSLPLTVAGLFGAISLRQDFIRQLFIEFPGPLELYALKHGFPEEFLISSCRQFVAVTILWVSAALLRGLDMMSVFRDESCSVDHDSWIFACFLFGSFLYCLILYCQLHVICVLGMIVDRYCIKLFPNPTETQSVLDWNLIQAMLRQIAGAFDFCFMMTQTGACASLLLVGIQVFLRDQLDVDDGECGATPLVPLLALPVLMASGAFLVFFKAAAVSEKCSRVAPLVNSMTFDDKPDALDVNRMNTVHFISSSAAGFYIQEVRISASMAMKLMYLTGLGAFALLTKMATDRSAGSL